MPDEVPMVASCSLCLSADEVQSMVTVEIDRRIAGGRIAIMICRSCAGAVVEAVGMAEPPLLHTIPGAEARAIDPLFTRDTWSEAAAIYGAFGDDPSWLESADLHAGEDSDDGKATD